jgi:hypothetical protein
MVDQSSFSYLKIVIICYEMRYPGILPAFLDPDPKKNHQEKATLNAQLQHALPSLLELFQKLVP